MKCFDCGQEILPHTIRGALCELCCDNRKTSQGERADSAALILDALDSMGLALANRDCRWPMELRKKYMKAVNTVKKIALPCGANNNASTPCFDIHESPCDYCDKIVGECGYTVKRTCKGFAQRT